MWIDELLAAIVGVRDLPMYLASGELEEMAIGPAKRRLKRCSRPRCRATGTTKASHHVRLYVLEGHLNPDRGRVEGPAASFGSCACSV